MLDAFADEARVGHGLLGVADPGGRLVAATGEGRRVLGTAPLHGPVEGALRRSSSASSAAAVAVPVAGPAGTVEVVLTPVQRHGRAIGVVLHLAGADGRDAEPLPGPGAGSIPAAPQARVVAVAGDRLAVLRAEEITFAESDGHDVWLETDRGRLRARDRGLGALEARLAGVGFLRVHRRYLVNAGRILEVVPAFKGAVWLSLDGGPHPLIPVSSRLVPALWRALEGHPPRR